MQIQNGKLYENKTWLYLFPCLKEYGEELMNNLSSFFKLAVGVGDSNFKNKGSYIFILFDTDLPLNTQASKSYKQRFSNFLNWISYQKYYVNDYVFSDLDTKSTHMLVLKLPEKINSTYIDFIKGNYSKMYNKEQIEKYFNIVENSSSLAIKERNKRVTKVRKVVFKDKKYLPEFVSIVNDKFKTNVGIEAFKEAELDFPPVKKEEIFNYETARTEI